jgi:hypothetical protein
MEQNKPLNHSKKLSKVSDAKARTFLDMIDESYRWLEDSEVSKKLEGRWSEE